MKQHRAKLSSMIAFLVATFGIAVAADRPGADATSPNEMARLRSHFTVVLRELREADVAPLTASQRSARAVLIGRLERYAAGGRFPHNHAVAGRYVPVFRDEHGTLCAMGFLIASTGRTDVVDDIARSANLARIPELAGDEQLRVWLDSTGLTVVEATRIQPAYDGDRCLGGCVLPTPPQPQVVPEHGVWAGYYVSSAAVSALSGASTALNLLSGGNPRLARKAASVGLIAGATQIVLGAFVFDRRHTPRAVGITNIALGGVSAGTSIWRMRHLPKEPSLVAHTVSVAPIVSSQAVGMTISRSF